MNILSILFSFYIPSCLISSLVRSPQKVHFLCKFMESSKVHSLHFVALNIITATDMLVAIILLSLKLVIYWACVFLFSTIICQACDLFILGNRRTFRFCFKKKTCKLSLKLSLETNSLSLAINKNKHKLISSSFFELSVSNLFFIFTKSYVIHATKKISPM